jgi:hypothetical protein
LSQLKLAEPRFQQLKPILPQGNQTTIEKTSLNFEAFQAQKPIENRIPSLQCPGAELD